MFSDYEDTSDSESDGSASEDEAFEDSLDTINSTEKSKDIFKPDPTSTPRSKRSASSPPFIKEPKKSKSTTAQQIPKNQQ